MTSTIIRPLRLVGVSGGLSIPSKSAALARHLMDLLAADISVQGNLVELGKLAPDLAGSVWRTQLPETVEHALQAVEKADALVVVAPVFRGAYPGLFKHFFDFVEQDALIDTPVLLAATGGSPRHSLMIDHQLRPLFSFFQARTCPLGVYATDQDFSGLQLHDAALLQRARQAVEKALPLIDLGRSRTHPDTRNGVAA